MTTPAVQSSLVIVGSNQPIAGLQEGLASSIADSVGTSADQVSVSEPVPTWAALVENGGIGVGRRLQAEDLVQEEEPNPRRTQSNMAPALQVDFEVFVPEDSNSAASEALAGEGNKSKNFSTMLNAMVEAVKTIRSNPGPLLSHVESKLAAQGINLTANFTRPLQARMAMPKKQTISARSVAGAWGPCGGVAACSNEVSLMRHREVRCVDGVDLTKMVSLSLCKAMEMPHSSEPCPRNATRPPTCGWRIGNWSHCVSTLPPKEDLQALRQDLCNASGLGKQYREVYCLMEAGRRSLWPETESCIKRQGPEPRAERQCHCVASEGSGNSLFAALAKPDDATVAAGAVPMQSTAPMALGALGPLMLVAVGVAGLMLALLVCCYVRSKRRQKGTNDQVSPEPDAHAVTVQRRSMLTTSKNNLNIPQVPASPAASTRSPLSEWAAASQATASPGAVSSAVSQSPKGVNTSKSRGSAALRSESVDSNGSAGSDVVGSLRAIMSRKPRPAALGDAIDDQGTGLGQRRQSRRALQAWSDSGQRGQSLGENGSTNETGPQRPGSLRRASLAAASQAGQRSRSQRRNTIVTPQGEQQMLQPWAPNPHASPPRMG